MCVMQLKQTLVYLPNNQSGNELTIRKSNLHGNFLNNTEQPR